MRPFSQSAEVTCRGCSLPLQRAVTDFGADHAFGQVPDKLQEHYGISLPSSTVRHITESHAQRMYENPPERIEAYPSEAGQEYVIAETDGSMVPIVEIDENAEDTCAELVEVSAKGKNTHGKRRVCVLPIHLAK